MGGSSFGYQESKNQNWFQSIVLDLLSQFQRSAQERAIGEGFGAAQGVRDWEKDDFPGVSPEQQSAIQAAMQQGMAGMSQFADMRDKAMAWDPDSQQWQNRLDAMVNQPSLAAMEQAGNIFGAEGAKQGHINRAYSSDKDAGLTNLQSQTAANIATGRAGLTVNEQARQDQIAQMAAQGAVGMPMQAFGAGEAGRNVLGQEVAFNQAFQQNQLNALLASLGLAAQSAGSVGMGLGSTGGGYGKGFGWNASIQAG